MRGALFETWVIGELLKHGCNRGEAPELHFWRDAAGHEAGLLVERAGGGGDPGHPYLTGAPARNRPCRPV